MGRAIVSVLVGLVGWYMTLNIILAIGFFSMGVDRAYQPGSYEVSNLWIGFMLVGGLIAALAGGWLCRLAAKRPGPVVAIAFLLVIFCVASAGFETLEQMSDSNSVTDASAAQDSSLRPEGESFLETLLKTKQPLWVMWSNVLITGLGVLVGGGHRVQTIVEAAQHTDDD